MSTILRAKNLYTKTCQKCEMTFRTDKAKARICPSCQRKTKNESQRSVKAERKKVTVHRCLPDTIPITTFIAIIEKYNRKYNTNYTYGQFVEAVKNGKIELKE